tara:strand:+ start:343 stop:1548 length:1206 start_codon:yes stop_codon:yes gene_type:complete
MPRQKLRDLARDALPTGYEGQNVPTDFSIPECGIEDVDRALFKLFDNHLEFVTSENEEAKKVPVIFATGERFALVKRRRPIRDINNTLILPLIAIRRTGIAQQFGWGLPRDTGDLVIKKRLSTKDPMYQSLVNNLRLKNQESVASRKNMIDPDTAPNAAKPGRVASRRKDADSNMQIEEGQLLSNNLKNNIYEVITIPFPFFYKLQYEVIFWTQYTSHMNQMIETLMNSYDIQGRNFKITTDKGYWFVAYLSEDLSSSDNFDNFTDDERIIKYTFNIEVWAWTLAPQTTALPSPFRKYLSAPQINFEIFDTKGQVRISGAEQPVIPGGKPDKFIMQDIESLTPGGDPILSDRRFVTEVEEAVIDPFSGEETKRYVQVLTRNSRQGETVASNRVLVKITDVT